MILLLDDESTVDHFCNKIFDEFTPSIQTIILQTIAGNKLANHKAIGLNYG